MDKHVVQCAAALATCEMCEHPRFIISGVTVTEDLIFSDKKVTFHHLS